jgi:phosphonate transport system permease protein
VLTILRGIPELVWALVFVRVFGLGPAAGVLALGLTYGGMLAKVYAEILESTDPAPARALRASGAGRIQALLYGLLPQAAKELTSYTVYRWECAIRASVVMGFVGAGGLGQLMDQAMKMLNGGEAASILLAFMLLVAAADLLSWWLRRALDAAPAARALPFGWRTGTFVLAACAALWASLRLLDIDFSALFTADAAASMGDFVRGFFPPDLSQPWLLKVLQGIWETLAISIVGTLLAAIAGLLLALPRWRAPWNVVLNVLRSVPELVWATITALAVGLGPFAGALALALHTTGVLGRLFAEALQNARPLPRMRSSSAAAIACWHFAMAPSRRSAAAAGIHAVPLGNEYPHGGDSGLCGSWRAGPAAVLRAFAVPLCPGQHRDHGHALAEHCRGLEQRGLRRAMR